MGSDIRLARTSELDTGTRQQIVDLFSNVFGKAMTLDGFDRKFARACRGFSYHGLLLHDRTVVGTFNAIPYRYRCFGKEYTFALSVDTMIHPQHRGGGHLRRMGELVYEAMIADGIPFVLGFPNEHYYTHEKRLFGTQDIGELDYYVLPINIGAVLKGFHGLDFLSRGVARLMAGRCTARNGSTWSYQVEKVVDQGFETHRYDDSYVRHALEQGASCITKTYEEERRVRVAYVIDVVPLSPAALGQAVRRAYDGADGACDMIIYVGKLPCTPPGLIRVPDFKKPQRVKMTGKVLVEEAVDERIFDIRNWNVNLSNIDVR